MYDLLTLPLGEAIILLAKMTVIIFWMIIMLGFAIRIILSSIMDGIAVAKHKRS